MRNRPVIFPLDSPGSSLDGMTEAEIRSALRKLRIDQGLTQEALAAKMGLSNQGMLSKMELGGVPIDVKGLQRWANALGCELDVSIRPAGERPAVITRLETTWRFLDHEEQDIIERFVRIAERGFQR